MTGFQQRPARWVQAAVRRRRQLTRDIVKRQPALTSSPSPPRPASLAWTRRPPSRKQKITGSLWPATWLSICMPFDGVQRATATRGPKRRDLPSKFYYEQKACPHLSHDTSLLAWFVLLCAQVQRKTHTQARDHPTDSPRATRTQPTSKTPTRLAEKPRSPDPRGQTSLQKRTSSRQVRTLENTQLPDPKPVCTERTHSHPIQHYSRIIIWGGVPNTLTWSVPRETSTPTRFLMCHDRSRSRDDIPGRTAGAARHSLTELASTKTLMIAGIAAAGR